jgi:hypothetical protein
MQAAEASNLHNHKVLVLRMLNENCIYEESHALSFWSELDA